MTAYVTQEAVALTARCRSRGGRISSEMITGAKFHCGSTSSH